MPTVQVGPTPFREGTRCESAVCAQRCARAVSMLNFGYRMLQLHLNRHFRY
jgi:hypothetical protein